MARAKTVIAEPVVEEVVEPVEAVTETPVIDPAAYAKAASELASAPIDEWAKTYGKVGLIGLRYDDGGVQWTTIGAIDPTSPDQAALQRALDGNYQTLLYVSDTFKVLLSTSRVDAKPFNAN